MCVFLNVAFGIWNLDLGGWNLDYVSLVSGCVFAILHFELLVLDCGFWDFENCMVDFGLVVLSCIC